MCTLEDRLKLAMEDIPHVAEELELVEGNIPRVEPWTIASLPPTPGRRVADQRNCTISFGVPRHLHYAGGFPGVGRVLEHRGGEAGHRPLTGIVVRGHRIGDLEAQLVDPGQQHLFIGYDLGLRGPVYVGNLASNTAFTSADITHSRDGCSIFGG